jgi:hypothetical protein
MSPIRRPRPVCVCIRLARSLGRALFLVLRILMIALSLGVAPPSRVVKPLRHEDAVVQVEEAEDA